MCIFKILIFLLLALNKQFLSCGCWRCCLLDVRHFRWYDHRFYHLDLLYGGCAIILQWVSWFYVISIRFMVLCGCTHFEPMYSVYASLIYGLMLCSDKLLWMITWFNWNIININLEHTTRDRTEITNRLQSNITTVDQVI